MSKLAADGKYLYPTTDLLASLNLVPCPGGADMNIRQHRNEPGRIKSPKGSVGSVPYKDPRAPQNLVPIGGLERELRHRLGDQHVLYRALRAEAAA